jgi:hypothetical protein
MQIGRKVMDAELELHGANSPMALNRIAVLGLIFFVIIGCDLSRESRLVDISPGHAVPFGLENRLSFVGIDVWKCEDKKLIAFVENGRFDVREYFDVVTNADRILHELQSSEVRRDSEIVVYPEYGFSRNEPINGDLGDRTYSFSCVNRSSHYVELSRVEPSCSCIKVGSFVGQKRLAPGASLQFDVNLSMGLTEISNHVVRVVWVSSDGLSSSVEIPLYGWQQDSIQIHPTTLGFGIEPGSDLASAKIIVTDSRMFPHDKVLLNSSSDLIHIACSERVEEGRQVRLFKLTGKPEDLIVLPKDDLNLVIGERSCTLQYALDFNHDGEL